MNSKQSEVFKQLVHAYYNDELEKVLKDILSQEDRDHEQTKQMLLSFCGVKGDIHLEDEPFVFDLIESITKQSVREKIIEKVHHCTQSCKGEDGKGKCQSVCPFDAIIEDEKTKGKWIDEALCMNCGRCITVCEKGHYLETQQFMPLAQYLKGDEKVIAIVAPAIAGQFKEATLDQLREAFILMGFTDMVEVAMAADLLSFKEALEYGHLVQDTNDLMITSCCCPMWIGMLKKVYHHLIEHVSPSVSPMIAMGRILKKLNPKVKVVFIGPCVAKKAEAKEPDIKDAVDYVLTFQEVQLIFEALEIIPTELKGVPSVDYASRGGRLYAKTGGVSQAVFEIIDEMYFEKRKLFKAVKADGVKACKEVLNDIEKGEIKATFIEGMGCVGGCVGGPKANIDKELGKQAVTEVAYDSAIKNPIHSEVFRGILKKLDIQDLEELRDQSSMFERKF